MIMTKTVIYTILESSCTHSTVYQVFLPSDRVVDFTYIEKIRPLTTVKMPLITQNLRKATKWRATSQIMNRNMQTFYSFTYSYSPLCGAIKS